MYLKISESIGSIFFAGCLVSNLHENQQKFKIKCDVFFCKENVMFFGLASDLAIYMYAYVVRTMPICLNKFFDLLLSYQKYSTETCTRQAGCLSRSLPMISQQSLGLHTSAATGSSDTSPTYL
jgi:hypothetical protein